MPTKKNIESPEQLYSLFEGYKEYCKQHPKYENFYNHKEGQEVRVSREVPLTWNGFEIYLRKEKRLAKLDDYKANKDGRYSEYADIIHAIGQEIYEDKFAGASVGIYQHNIIARDLGLSDKKETEVKGSIIYLDEDEEI